MREFPKLRYPIHTKGLTKEDEHILLAYDIIFRMKAQLKSNNLEFHADLQHDTDANLSNLGHHIETMLCGGDMALRFEGYDGMGSKSMVDHFQEKVDREIKQSQEGEVK